MITFIITAKVNSNMTKLKLWKSFYYYLLLARLKYSNPAFVLQANTWYNLPSVFKHKHKIWRLGHNVSSSFFLSSIKKIQLWMNIPFNKFYGGQYHELLCYFSISLTRTSCCNSQNTTLLHRGANIPNLLLFSPKCCFFWVSGSSVYSPFN
jgi:hypothetical protein